MNQNSSRLNPANVRVNARYGLDANAPFATIAVCLAFWELAFRLGSWNETRKGEALVLFQPSLCMPRLVHR